MAHNVPKIQVSSPDEREMREHILQESDTQHMFSPDDPPDEYANRSAETQEPNTQPSHAGISKENVTKTSKKETPAKKAGHLSEYSSPYAQHVHALPQISKLRGMPDVQIY